MSIYVVVEGHGERAAAQNLLSRLALDLGLDLGPFAEPIRESNVASASGIERAAERVRATSSARGLLILRDDEDGCPKTDGPSIAASLRAMKLPFPAAVVLAYREYESLFLPCIAQMAGRAFPVVGGLERPGLRADASFRGDLEASRDVKGILTGLMAPGKIDKPASDQLALTRMVDFNVVRQSGLPWFGTLERALKFLEASVGTTGTVYP